MSLKVIFRRNGKNGKNDVFKIQSLSFDFLVNVYQTQIYLSFFLATQTVCKLCQAEWFNKGAIDAPSSHCSY